MRECCSAYSNEIIELHNLLSSFSLLLVVGPINPARSTVSPFPHRRRAEPQPKWNQCIFGVKISHLLTEFLKTFTDYTILHLGLHTIGWTARLEYALECTLMYNRNFLLSLLKLQATNTTQVHMRQLQCIFIF